MPTTPRFLLTAVLLCAAAALVDATQDADAAAERRRPPTWRTSTAPSTSMHEGVAERADAPMMLLDGDLLRTASGRAESSSPTARSSTSTSTPSSRSSRPTPAAVARRVPSCASQPRRRSRTSSTRQRPPCASTRAASTASTADGTPERRRWSRSHAASPRSTMATAARVVVRGGEMASCSARLARGPSIQPFNSARWDAFDAVVDERATASRRRSRLRNSRPSCARMGRCSINTGAGITSRRTATCGFRRSASAGGPTTTAPGSHALRLDVVRARSLGVADASLRPLGFHRQLLVLDSGPRLGSGVGELGIRARLRQLVAARVGWLPGHRVRGRPSATDPVAVVDHRPARSVRVSTARARARDRRRPTATRGFAAALARTAGDADGQRATSRCRAARDVPAAGAGRGAVRQALPDVPRRGVVRRPVPAAPPDSTASPAPAAGVASEGAVARPAPRSRGDRSGGPVAPGRAGRRRGRGACRRVRRFGTPSAADGAAATRAPGSSVQAASRSAPPRSEPRAEATRPAWRQRGERQRGSSPRWFRRSRPASATPRHRDTATNRRAATSRAASRRGGAVRRRPPQ